MRQIHAVALHEARWQFQRWTMVLVFSCGMLLPLLNELNSLQDIQFLLAAQTRLFVLAGPAIMTGALSRDARDHMKPLLQSVGISDRTYPFGKYLGVAGFHMALLVFIGLVSTGFVIWQMGLGAAQYYLTWSLAALPPCAILFSACSLVLDGILAHPWWPFPFMLGLEAAFLLFAHPLSPVLSDTAAALLVAAVERNPWAFSMVRYGAAAGSGVLIVGAYSALASAWKQRRGGT